MTLHELAVLALKLSVVAIVFSLGLRTTARDVVFLFGKPSLLLRSILAMNIVMLIFAVIVVVVFPMALPVKIALVALSLSPVPPILPGKQTKAGGSATYTMSLLVVASLVSIVLIPLALAIVGQILGTQYSVSISKLIIIVMISVVAPLILGLIVRHFLPTIAEKAAGPIGLFAMILLVLSALPIAYTTGIVLWHLVGDGVVIFLLLFSLLGLVVGHFLGGPDEDDRTVLALATAARHPAVALAIATVNYPEEKATLAVLLWHLVFAIVVSIPYVRWRKGLHRTVVEGADQGHR